MNGMDCGRSMNIEHDGLKTKQNIRVRILLNHLNSYFVPVHHAKVSSLKVIQEVMANDLSNRGHPDQPPVTHHQPTITRPGHTIKQTGTH